MASGIKPVDIGTEGSMYRNGRTINEIIALLDTLLPAKSTSGFIKLTNGPGGLVLDDSDLIAAIRAKGVQI